jgi:leucyl-tRNA synthetase
MELVNELYAFAESAGVRPTGRDDEPPAKVDRRETAAVIKEAVEALVLMLSPFAPHMCEELWERLGHAGGIVAAGWPSADEAAAREEEIEIPVQVNGKLRGRITVPADATEAQIEAAALAAPAIQPHIAGKQIVKVIVARGRLVSIVVK